MKIKLVNVDEFIQVNQCLEVTNPVYFSNGRPTEDGLFSPTIFGELGTEDRRTKFGYIDLHGKFLQPIIYKVLTSLDSRIDSIISGTGYYRLDPKGNLVEDGQRGETGLDFLYKIVEQLKFAESESPVRKTKIKLIKGLKKDEMFMDKWLVLPAFLRDYNPKGSVVEVDAVNDIYAKIIRTASSIDGTTLNFLAHNSRANLQKNLVTLYTDFTESLAHKKGLIRRSLLGKSVDYATRSVITAPKVNSKSYDKLEIKFGYTGVPLSQIITLFYPFFVKYIEDFVKIHREELSRFKDKDGKDIYIPNIEEQFSAKGIEKILEGYIKNIEGRFSSLTVKDQDGKVHPVQIFSEQLKRNFTLTDIVYIAAVDICADKHVFVTRYPVESFLNIYPSKIKILSTKNTMEMRLPDRYLENYPVIYPDYPVDEETFVDSVRPSLLVLGALGADFDGDTVSLRGVFTKEANQEAERMINSKTMIIGQGGNNARGIGNEAVLSLYTLTHMDWGDLWKVIYVFGSGWRSALIYS